MNVPAAAAGSRLDKFLAEVLGSRAAAERAIAAGALVDGVARPKSHRLEGGEEVRLAAEPPAGPAEEELPEIRVAYEDDHVVVVDKPAGVVVHPGAGRPRGTLVDALAGKLAGGDPERPGVVHRLDRDTSGLLVLARTEEAFDRLAQLVRARSLERTYLALVRGRPRSRSGRIEAAIGRDRSEPTRQSLDTDTPRDAITHFEVVELLGEHALLRVRLETGRTHQIRVHLAAIDLPVVGDRVYGVPGLGLERQFLHAARLAFPHPITGAWIETESPLPPDLSAALSLAATSSPDTSGV
jgi:23S rRNA pseudouridine1911/1915/1917 synthase